LQFSVEVAIGMMRKELESSVGATEHLVGQYPDMEDFKKSLAISEAYLEFIKTAPTSFFE